MALVFNSVIVRYCGHVYRFVMFFAHGTFKLTDQQARAGEPFFTLGLWSLRTNFEMLLADPAFLESGRIQATEFNDVSMLPLKEFSLASPNRPTPPPLNNLLRKNSYFLLTAGMTEATLYEMFRRRSS